MTDTEKALQAVLQQARAEGWQQGFYAGQDYATARERHDPQWDMVAPPEIPQNPYRLG